MKAEGDMAKGLKEGGMPKKIKCRAGAERRLKSAQNVLKLTIYGGFCLYMVLVAHLWKAKERE